MLFNTDVGCGNIFMAAFNKKEFCKVNKICPEHNIYINEKKKILTGLNN